MEPGHFPSAAKERRRRLAVVAEELRNLERRELERASADVHPAPESAEPDEESAMVDRIQTRLASRLADIRGALGRVEDGSFGVCLTCGRPIDISRLEAMPTATRCAPCAEKRDDSQSGFCAFGVGSGSGW